MIAVRSFLLLAKKRLARHRALVWTVRGLAVAGVALFAVQVVTRRWPVDQEWPWTVAAAVMGGLVGAAGWLRGRTSLGEVARIADIRLGGHERLTTALELSDRDDAPLVALQRSDAEFWVGTADPQHVVSGGLPRREVAAAAVAVLLAGGLSFMPNPALARHRSDRAGEAVRDKAAEGIEKLAQEAETAARPGEKPERRQALVKELEAAAQALREVGDDKSAVAALSKAQETLRALGDPSASERQNALTAAGSQMAQSGAGAAAGSALAAAGTSAAGELEQLASQLPGMSPEERAAVAAQLAEAAAAAADPAQAERLRKASEDLAAGRTAAAEQALAEAARAQQERNAARAASELEKLGDSLKDLTPEQRAELAEALERAAAEAADDPELAKALAEAAKALREGRLDDAAAALDQAAQLAQSLPAESALDGDVSEASNILEEAKDALLGEVPPSTPGESPDPGEGDKGRGEAEGEGQDPGEVGEPGGQPGGQPAQAPGQGPAAKGGSGQPASGQGGSSGQGDAGQGGGGRGGSGSGQGAATFTQGRGGTGPRGVLGERPGAPSEQVYVPGLSGAGRAQTVPGDSGTGQGVDTALVPYESVYGEYRASALSQADRQLIPQRLRGLLTYYFQDTPP